MNDPLQNPTKPQGSIIPFGTPDTMHSHKSFAKTPGYDTDIDIDDGPRKRLRIENDSGSPNTEDVSLVVKRRIFQISSIPETTLLAEALPNIKYVYSLWNIIIQSFNDSRDMYPELDDATQCELFFWIGRLACAGAKQLTESLATCRQRSTQYNCSLCDNQLPRMSRTSAIIDTDSNDLISILAVLSKLPQLHRSGKPRVAAMLAIERALNHCKEQAHLDLTASVFGQCCLQALRSSSRDLRIAAGYDICAKSDRTIR